MSQLKSEILGCLKQRGPRVAMKDIQISVSGTRAEIALTIARLIEAGLVIRNENTDGQVGYFYSLNPAANNVTPEEKE